MGSFSAWHWIIVALVILVLFGRGKISETMGDFGRGIKSFRKGLAEEDKPSAAPPPSPPPAQIAPPAEAPAPTPAQTPTQSPGSSDSSDNTGG